VLRRPAPEMYPILGSTREVHREVPLLVKTLFLGILMKLPVFGHLLSKRSKTDIFRYFDQNACTPCSAHFMGFHYCPSKGPEVVQKWSSQGTYRVTPWNQGLKGRILGAKRSSSWNARIHGFTHFEHKTMISWFLRFCTFGPVGLHPPEKV
jgi:hypothetical protein